MFVESKLLDFTWFKISNNSPPFDTIKMLFAQH